MLFIPDVALEKVYKEEIAPFLSEDKILGFSHGFNLVFEKLRLPENNEYILLAPRATGIEVRKAYLKGAGAPAAVTWKSEQSRDITLAYAKAIGCAHNVVFKTTLQEEVFSNLFSEQCALPGGVIEILKKSYEVLIEKGISPLMAYFECFYKLKILVDVLDQKGIEGFYRSISSTASLGALTIGPRVIDNNVKDKMKTVFNEIALRCHPSTQVPASAGINSGWDLEKNDPKLLEDLLLKERNHPLEKMFSEMRALLSPGFSKSENVFCETKKTFSDA